MKENKGDFFMKKIFTVFAIIAAFYTVQSVFAHHYTGDFHTQNHHNDFYQTLNHNGGYTGADAQAAGGYANSTRMEGTRGGFITDETNTKYTTVLNAKKMGNDSYVTLKGKIVSKTGNEKYLFKDATGTIQIEIDDEDWGGIKAGPKDTVIIEGEVDKDWDSISIDVYTIKLAK